MNEIEKKAIEEMASDIEQSGMIDSPSRCKIVAEELYYKGYSKQSHGHWEIVKGSNGKEKMVCTNCQHQQDLASTFTYCPNCGARMKGGE